MNKVEQLHSIISISGWVSSIVTFYKYVLYTSMQSVNYTVFLMTGPSGVLLVDRR